MKTRMFFPVALAGTVLSLPLQAATNYVRTANPGAAPPYTSWATAATNIQDAVNAAIPGNTVLVTNGTYRPPADIVVTQAIRIASVNGALATTIDGNATNRAFDLQANAIVDGFTITNGYAVDNGGGVLCANGGTVQNCVLAGNTAASYGGGIFFWAGGGALLNCLVRSNRAVVHDGGGVYCRAGNVVRNCLFAGNTGNDGGAAYCYAGGSIENCTLTANQGARGGGVFCYVSGGVVSNSIVYGNTAVSGPNWYFSSGGAFDHACTTPATGNACLTNDPRFADAAAGNYRLLPLSPCIDSGAASAWMATAADLDGQPRVSGCGVDLGAYEYPWHYVSLSGSHVAPYLSWATAATNIQSAIDAAGPGHTVLVTNGVYLPPTEIAVTQSIRIASVSGAAATIVNGRGARRVFNIATNAVVDGFTITNGYAADNGGGVFCANGGTVQNCLLAGNTAAGYGGGVFFGLGGGSLLNCIVRSNRASANDGGGVYCRAGNLVRNCLIAGNTGYNGGGVFCEQGGLLENCTVAGNQGTKGGGIHCWQGGTVSNSVVYGNATSNQGTNWFFNGGGSFDHSCTTPSSGTACLTNDPCFAGAAAGDYRLLPRSSCIDYGATSGWMATAMDLDGQPRVTGAGVDLGAYEYPFVHYVSPVGGHVAPFASWASAATDLVAAVDAAHAGALLIVTNGVYYPPAEIAVTQSLRIASVNGAATTILNGRGARRLFNIAANAVIDGFTITNAYAADNGGGVLCANGGTVQNCVLAGNTAASYGGGIFFWGGGGALLNSIVRSNRASANDGGGVYCRAGNVVRNCLIVENSGHNGGGAFCYNGGLLDNCTVARNQGTAGGGVHCYQPGGTITNSIVYDNTAGSGPNWSFNGGGSFDHSCTTPSSGVACVTNAPRFLDATSGNFHLSASSPCIDKGAAAGWMAGTTDLGGQPRVADGDLDGTATVDMGAYEFPRRFVGAWRTRALLAGGYAFSLAVRSNGTVAAWGDNGRGQCVVPASGSEAEAVAGGDVHALALRRDGTVVGWGGNDYGQCVPPSPNEGFVAIAAGSYHSLGLKADGSAVGWGRNDSGQTAAPDGRFKAVAAYDYHSAGLTTGGTVVAWGDLTLVPADNSNLTAVAMGGLHGVALRANGTLTAWSVNNQFGQLDIPLPNTNFTAIACGWAHSLALRADGSVAAWGLNDFGQCNVPAPNSNFIAVACGEYHSLGLKANGTVVAWGWNYSGQSSPPAPNAGLGPSPDVLPARGPTSGGTTVAVYGMNLCDGSDATNVTVCGVAATAIVSAAASRVAALTGPSGAVGIGHVTVWSRNFGSVTRSNAFTYYGPPSVVTGPVTNAGPTTAVGGGVVTADNLDPVTARGLCWGAAPNPTLTNAFAASGSGTGVFSGVTIAGLPAGTYHARAWATNAAGAAYGADAPFAIGTLTGDFTTGATNRFIPISNQILFTSAFSGANTNPLSYFWDFEADGVVDAQGTNLATIIHTYVQPGLYSVRLTVSNSWGESVVVTHAACLRIATMHFVSPYGTHQAPYTNWTTAATNPAAAVAAAADYDTVLVTNGTYAVTAQISVDTGVQILSVNGAVATTIRRADTAPWCRIFRLNHARAVVDGFTIANGVGSDGPWQSNSGGGVMCLGGATLRNCILTGNTASEGGGVYCDGGLVLNCVLAGNSATIAYGGGISCQGSGIVRNCLVTRNSARIYGGGIHLQNGAQAQSCTVAGNTAGWNGGGLYCFFNGETVTNSIIWGNTAPADANWGTNGTASFGYCCTLPAPPGAGHVTNAPAFVDPSQDDYRLTGPFAGIDGGTNQAWMAGALDLAGNGRIWRGTVDMGAYEEGPLICSIVPDRTADLVGSSTPFQFLGTVAGQNLAGLYYRWDFQNDGAVDAQGPTQSLVSCLYPAVGRYSVRLTVSNGAGEVASNLKTNLILVAPLTNFVSTTGSALFPYTNWSTAAREIAAALGAAFDGTTVLVSNGTYSSGAEVQIANAIAVRGVNGAACTVVDRGGAGRGFRLSHSNAVLEGLTIRGGFTSENGGGVRIDGAGTVRRCILRDNHANNNGGGVYLDGGGRIESCLLIRNWAWRGGGVYGIGGTVENGTIAANSGMDGGGFYGVGSASVTNTIIQFNTAPNGANYYTGGPDVTYGFCCAQPALAGSGNVTNDPQFADTAYDNYRLWTNSPCLNAGTNRSWMAAAGDLDGRPRLRQSVVEMGAYESSGLFCRMDANKTAGTVGLSAAFDFTADVYGAAPSSLRFFWDFEDDGTVDAAGTGLQAVSHAYAYPAIYSVSLTVTNGAGDSALARRLSWIRVAPTQLCVWAGGAQTYPYTNWATAARSIQTGVDGAYDGTVVLVADGAYAVAAPVLVTNAIRVCSVSGAAAASVDGGYPARSNGCFSLSHTGAVVDGFSIQHGAASQGGGVRVAAGTVQNCRIVGNYTWSAGGGAWVSSGGLLRNCAISNNTAMAPVLSSVSGGGVCVLNGGAVRNCLVVGNAATTAPGVAFAFGGGIYAKAGSAVRNCTVAGNLAQGFACGGGGTYAEPGAAVANSIVYFNVPNNAEGSGTWTACCALPNPGGSGNITNNPAFLSTGNYRLQASSPCIDSGASAGAPADDLDGTPRPLDGNADGTAAWDIGAYEFVSGTADTDQDGMKDGDELAAGTDPRDPASKLTLVSIGGIGGTGAGALLRWLSVAGKTYAIDATANRTEAFSALASNLAATAPTNAYVDATFTNAPRRFYRIRLQP